MCRIGLKSQTALFLVLLAIALMACGGRDGGRKGNSASDGSSGEQERVEDTDSGEPVYALLVSPAHPRPGEDFRILATGDRNIRKSRLEVAGPAGSLRSAESRHGDGLPCWRADTYRADAPGVYRVRLPGDRGEPVELEFSVADNKPASRGPGSIWKTERGWDAATESLYAAWINALFLASDERSSWKALHEVMQDPSNNLLYNHLGLKEDDPAASVRVIMEPDCADNPFYFRAYFAWKLGLPFGYHECDRGYLGKPPQTGRWITNETPSSASNPVQAFNAFLRRVMDGIHSGTARTALSNDQSDYYPVRLSRDGLRPGVVYADPYGHTLIIVKWVPQDGGKPGKLLAVDAQPDKTIAVKRFWKGNFLFETREVVGEPGFKAFRPIFMEQGRISLPTNREIEGFPRLAPFSIEQKGMEPAAFYHAMDLVINPKLLDPETGFLDLINALHEQLIVRVNSVGNGEDYMKAHPGTVIPMPGKASGVFLAGGQWENFSTPNRDLRLLIAMDAVLEFPARVAASPGDFKMPKFRSPEQVAADLRDLLEKKSRELTITYTRTDGSQQMLTMGELLARRDAFEMAYNPNDGIEIRWGAPEGSDERSTCRRKAPGWQQETMKLVSVWFRKRQHPPT